jgi:putative flippase GtrA
LCRIARISAAKTALSFFPVRVHLRSLSRNTLTSIFTTALDVGVLIGLVELCHVHYVIATWTGTIVGALSNFFINRHWSFEAHRHSLRWQLARFVPVQAGSSLWQTSGVWFLTGVLGLQYIGSKVTVAVLVYLFWNYPMNRMFVFRDWRAQKASREGSEETRRRAA